MNVFGCWDERSRSLPCLAAPSAATQHFYFCDTALSHLIQTQREPATPAYPPCNCSQICGIRVLAHGLGPRELAYGVGGPGRRTLTESAQDGCLPRGTLGGAQTGLRRYHIYRFLRSLRLFLALGFVQTMLYIYSVKVR